MNTTVLSNCKNKLRAATRKNLVTVFVLSCALFFIAPATASGQAGKAVVAVSRVILARQAARAAAAAAARRAAARAAAKRAAATAAARRAAAARSNAGGKYRPGRTQRPAGQRYAEETLVNFCNRTGEPELQVAIGYAGSTGGRTIWLARGWHRVPNGQCRSVSLGGNYQGYVYAYAVNQDASLEWSGNHRFYVDWHNGFNVRQDAAGLGRNENFRAVGMSEFRVAPGVNNYNYR